MPTSIIDGPHYAYGDMGKLLAATFGSAVGDPNSDAGPNGVFQGVGILDPRYWFNKDLVTGYRGRAAIHYMSPSLVSVNQIPAALGAANICPAAHPAAGVAMTFATRTVGVERSIPIIPFNAGGALLGAVTTAAVALDFGFAWGTVVAASKTVVVADSSGFSPGMPIVIAGVGNAGGTVPLLTNVAGITDTTHITIQDAPAASLNPASIGTGNIWGPSPATSQNQFVTPTAHMPFLAGGPGLFLDPRQTVARVVRVVGLSSGTGGHVTVRGWDVYGMPMTETITLASGANTVYGVKAFKFIASVTPDFTDSINVSIGTGDVFGFHYRAGVWEDTTVSWNAIAMTVTQGYTAPLALITAATATNADVRGTVQTGAAGAGTGIGSTASNGTVSGLAMSGVRLMMRQTIMAPAALLAKPETPATMFGNTQF